MQLHRIDPKVPLEDQLGELAALQSEGKIRHIGLSEVGIEQIKQAAAVAPIVSVQNRYNLTDRASEDVMEYAERESIAFIPWFPLATGQLSAPGSPLAELAKKHEATASQLALAWLLHRSPVMLPIPGTSSVEHLQDNLAAARIELTSAEFEALTNAV